MKSPLFSLLYSLLFFFITTTTYCKEYTIKEITKKEIRLNSTKNLKERILILFELATYYQENNIVIATNYRKSLEKLIAPNSSKKVELEILIIKEKLLKQDFENIIEKITALKSQSNKIAAKDLFLELAYLEAQFYYQKRDFEKSKKIIAAILKNYKNSKTLLIANFYLLKASIGGQELNFDLQLMLSQKAQKIYELKKNNAGINKCKIQITYNYLYRKNFDKAILFVKEALNSNRDTKSNLDLMKEKLALGTVFFYLKKYDIAKTHLTTTMQINKATQLNNDGINTIALRYLNLSNFELGNYDAVLNYCTTELKKTKDNYCKYALYYQLTVTNNKIKNFTSAKIYLDSMQVIADKDKNFTKVDRIEYLTEAATTEAGLGNFKKAYDYSQQYNKKYRVITDSINAQLTIENQTRFELNDKDLNLKKLQIKEQATKIELLKNRKETSRLYVILYFVLAIVYVILMIIRRNKKKNKLLTEQNELIQRKETQLRHSNETIKKTFSIISHDLREPFNVMLGYSEYILENHKGLKTEEVLKYVQVINKAAKTNLDLTNQLLSWSLQQQGGFYVNKKMQKVHPIINSVLNNFQALADISLVQLDYKKSDILVSVDKDILTNILNNLVTNAIKNAKQTTSITIKDYLENDQLYIEVINQGDALTEDTIAELNSPVQQKQFEFNKETNDFKGGFGLVYIKELINLYDGTIYFYCNQKEGCIVKVILPI